MKDFDEFWPYYLKAYAHPKNRRLHFLGTAIVHLILFYVFVTGDIKFLWLVPFFAYLFVWAGHLVIEKKLPATFKHPLWSVLADFRLFYLLIFKKL